MEENNKNNNNIRNSNLYRYLCIYKFIYNENKLRNVYAESIEILILKYIYIIINN